MNSKYEIIINNSKAVSDSTLRASNRDTEIKILIWSLWLTQPQNFDRKLHLLGSCDEDVNDIGEIQNDLEEAQYTEWILIISRKL